MKQVLSLILILLSVNVLAQNKSNYRIYNTLSGQETTLEEMIAGIQSSEVVFFGEEHNDPTAHDLQVSIYKLLHNANGNEQALSLEMFETDVQQTLNEYLGNLIHEKNFIKEARAWNNYADYRQLIEFSKEHNLDVIAANTPKRYVNLVTRKGLSELIKLDKTSRQWLPPLPIDTATGPYYAKFVESLGGHSMPGMQIFQSQNLWDAGMAYSISNYLKRTKNKNLFQVNGRFHSDEKLGAVAQLLKYRPRTTLKTISCFSDKSFKNPDWSTFKHLGDFVIITNPELKRTF